MTPETPKNDPSTPSKGKGSAHGKGGGVSRRPGFPKPGNKGGRPGSLTKRAHKEIIECIELLGMPESRASRACGFDESTLGKWKTRGRLAKEKWETLTPEEQKEETPYVRFFDDLREAEFRYEKANLIVIQNAAVKGDWRAAERRLALKWPDRYGKRVMIGGDPQNPTPIPTTGKAPVIYIPDNGRDPGLRKPDAKPKPPR